MFKNLRNSNGSALVIALLMMIMLSFLTIASVTTSVQDMGISYNTKEKTRAFYIAEAGIERAFAQLKDSVQWRTGYTNATFGGGAYSVVVEDSTTDPSLDSNIMLTATGSLAFGESVVEVVLAPTFKSLFNYAAFGDEFVDFSSQSWTDAYDSDSGSYSSQATNGPDEEGNMYGDEEGAVGSNGEITLTSNSQIHGDANTSSPGDLNISDGDVHGDTSSTAPTNVLDPVPPADLAYAEANNSAPAGLTFVGDASYNSTTNELLAENTSTVIFNSGTYYFSSAEFLGGSKLQLAAGAEVKIYMTGDFRVTSGGKVNVLTDGIPGNLQIYSTGANFRLESGTECRAAVYAPNAIIDIESGGDNYGAFIGRQVYVESGSAIHYDIALSRLNTAGGDGYKKISWREIY